MRRLSLAVAGFIFVAWVFYVGATWGPRSVDSGPARRTDSGNTELVEESKRLQSEFEAIAAQRAPTEQDLALLQDAVARQREHNLARPPSTEDRRRREELEDRLAHFLARAIHEESLEAEKEAERRLAEGDVLAAVESIQQAFDLQRTVNRTYGRSAFRDTSRETRLQQQVLTMEAEPLYARSLELEEAAEAATKEFKWSDARPLLTEALELQARINEGSRRSAYYNPARHESLSRKIAGLLVGEMMSEVQQLQEQAQEQESSGQWESAAQLFERAMVIQNRINRDHAQSPFVSTERVTELDSARQTALSGRQAMELEKILREMRRALVAGDFAAAEPNIDAAVRLVGQIFGRFPRSRYANFNVRLEVEYLAMVQEALPDLQRSLREELLPVPGQNGWQMARAPVSQRLYARVMSANPSRNLGEDLPVDSVTLRQAREFCRRASWILARPVQLPERSHFAAALGEWDPETYSVLSWHKENSGGSTHPVASGVPNEYGFLHLAGNLRSWLDDNGSDDGSIWTAGVSYAEEFPQEEPFRQIGSDKRDPSIGFRYMVGAAEG